MTPKQILEFLRADGIEVACEHDNLKVRSIRSKITDEHKTLISANKSVLMAHLRQPQNGPENNLVDHSEEVSNSLSATKQPPADATSVFKEYNLPNGETLRLTEKEFDRVVDLFRLLHQQSKRIVRSSDTG
jgi:hypothetical protein